MLGRLSLELARIQRRLETWFAETVGLLGTEKKTRDLAGVGERTRI